MNFNKKGLAMNMGTYLIISIIFMLIILGSYKLVDANTKGNSEKLTGYFCQKTGDLDFDISLGLGGIKCTEEQIELTEKKNKIEEKLGPVKTVSLDVGTSKYTDNDLGFKTNNNQIRGYFFTKSCEHTDLVLDVNKLDSDFLKESERLAKKYKITRKEFLQLIAFETARTFSPCILSSIWGVGLIQFSESNAIYLETTVLELSKMTQTKQLEYVEKHLDKIQKTHNKGKPYENQIEVYLAIFYPAGLTKTGKIIIPKGIPAYTNNPGIDTNDNGIEKFEIEAKLIANTRGINWG